MPRTFLPVSAGAMLITSWAVLAWEPHQREVVIDEGTRPKNTWRAYSGECAHDLYTVELATGKFSLSSIRDLRINGRSRRDNARRALAKASLVGSAVDAIVDRCSRTAARVRIEVADPAQKYQLKFYYLWVSRSGNVNLLLDRPRSAE